MTKYLFCSSSEEDEEPEYTEPIKFTPSSNQARKQLKQVRPSTEVAAASRRVASRSVNPFGFTSSSKLPSSFSSSPALPSLSSSTQFNPAADVEAESDYYSEVTPEPPSRPAPPFSDRAIDDWCKKMNDDFNCIYQRMVGIGGGGIGGGGKENIIIPTRRNEAGGRSGGKEIAGSGMSSKRMTKKESKKRTSNHHHHHSHKHQGGSTVVAATVSSFPSPSAPSSVGGREGEEGRIREGRVREGFSSAPKVVISDWTESSNPSNLYEMSHYREPPPIPTNIGTSGNDGDIEEDEDEGRTRQTRSNSFKSFRMSKKCPSLCSCSPFHSVMKVHPTNLPNLILTQILTHRTQC